MKNTFIDSEINRNNAKETLVPIAINTTKYIFLFIIIVGIIEFGFKTFF